MRVLHWPIGAEIYGEYKKNTKPPNKHCVPYQDKTLGWVWIETASHWEKRFYE